MTLRASRAAAAEHGIVDLGSYVLLGLAGVAQPRPTLRLVHAAQQTA